MRQLTGALGGMLAAPFLLAAAPSDPPSSELLKALTPSVVRVVREGCGPEKAGHVGTGFVWPAPGHVVTDLHLVAGCTGPISATYWTPSGKTGARPATIEHVLVSRDLVILGVPGAPPEAKPLEVETDPPRPDDMVKVYGYARGIAAPDEKRLVVSLQTETFPELRYSLDDDAAKQLTALKFPQLDTNVVHLDGSLSPGHSGAPIINGAGRVVGIGSGGLAQGAAGLSWAVRARYLQELGQGGTEMPVIGSAPGALFAMLETPPAPPAGAGVRAEPEIPSVTCGELTLTRQAARPLRQLVATSPNRANIRRLAAEALHVSLDELAGETFEIWSEPQSGAAIVVPPGAQLVTGPRACATAHREHPGVFNLVRLAPLPDMTASPEWQADVEEQQWLSLGVLARNVSAGLYTVPGAGAWASFRVVNGTLIERRAMANPQASGGRHPLIYRADMAGRGAYVLVGAVARDTAAQMSAEESRIWAESVLAVYLSTFPRVSQSDPRQDTPERPTGSDDANPLTLPVGFGALRRYPVLTCVSSRFIRLTQVVPADVALRSSADPKAVADLVTQVTTLRPSVLGGSQFDIWKEPRTGLRVLLPRGDRPIPQPDLKLEGLPESDNGQGLPCAASAEDAPDLQFALIGLNSGAPEVDGTVRRALDRITGTTLAETDAGAGLRRFDGPGPDGRKIRVHLAEARRRGATVAMALIERDSRPRAARPDRYGAALAEDLVAVAASLQPDRPGD